MSFSVLILLVAFIALGLFIILLSSENFYRFIGIMFIVLGVMILVGFRSQMLEEIEKQEQETIHGSKIIIEKNY